jgi:hypothetical protein
MTGHGFRAVASTILNETGHFKPDVIEPNSPTASVMKSGVHTTAPNTCQNGSALCRIGEIIKVRASQEGEPCNVVKRRFWFSPFDTGIFNPETGVMVLAPISHPVGVEKLTPKSKLLILLSSCTCRTSSS